MAPISTRVPAILLHMLLFCRASALSLMVLLSVSPLAVAQDAEKSELQAIEQDIAVSAERQAELLAQAKAAVEEQNTLSDRLVAMAETTSAQERQLADIEKRQGKLKTEIAAINLDFASKQDVIAEVLAGLQRLEHNPPPALVVAPDDVLSALRGAMVFGTIVPELRNTARKLHDQLTELKTLREQLTAQTAEHHEALTALEASRIDIKKLIDEKKTLALSSQQELDVEKQHAEELAAKATSLKQLLDALEKQRLAVEAKQSAEAKARAEAERQLQEKALQPQMAFSKAKGQINYPAEGRILKVFGDETGVDGRLDGIVIATATEAQVTSPITGKIEFAGKFRSYGQMVIINPGEGYLVLLAGLSQSLVTHGQSVKAGEPVGMMGEKPGKLAMSNGLTNLTTPVLYVEFRKNGDPVDPAPWWIGIRREAMR